MEVKAMKQLMAWTAVFLLIVGFMCGGALAVCDEDLSCPWTPPEPGPASVSGSGNIFIKDIHGFNGTGGLVCGEANFSFEALERPGLPIPPPCNDPTGDGSANGSATAGSFQLPNIAHSANTLSVDSMATVNAGLMGSGSVSVDGQAGQTTRAALKVPPCSTGIFGSGENSTQATYSDSLSGETLFGPITVSGAANAQGATLVEKLPSDPNVLLLKLVTEGSSDSTNSNAVGNGASSASGFGEAAGGAQVILPANIGLATGAGEAGYEASGSSGASGSFAVTGEFSSTILPGNFLEHEAHVTVSSDSIGQNNLPLWPTPPCIPPCN